MNELQSLRYQLIDIIMGISDVKRLRALYQKAQPLPLMPNPKIPVVEIKSGVTLEEIRAGQTVEKINFEEHMKRVSEIQWDKPLIEILQSLD